MTDPHSEDAIREVILESIADGVFTIDGAWHITSFNGAAERITGVPRNEAIGQRCCDVFRSSVCESECVLRRTMESGRPIVNKTVYIVNAEGERVPISVSTAVLRGEEGTLIGGVETFRDLSMVEELRKELHEKYTFEDIIGRSPAMRRLFDMVPLVAESDSTVLLEGASGTGKELFARAIHNLSRRRDKPFVAVNCGALPDNLLESELFGYKAGAFTDARKDKPGRFVLAHGGTLFLDEIGDVSPAMQVRLLRALQERVVEPLGGVKPIPVDVRVITATNRNLTTLLRKGGFREDLYYRINVIRITLPALRDRREDIPLLVDHFVAKFSRLRSKDVSGVTEEVLAALMDYDYPGNVRELENIIEHAFVHCREGLIELEHLPAALRPSETPLTTQTRRGGTLQALTKVHIEDALRHHGGSRKAAAEELGINPSTLYRKAKALGIDLPQQDGRTSRTP
jgi:PAS domain S-box-containing protein